MFLIHPTYSRESKCLGNVQYCLFVSIIKLTSINIYKFASFNHSFHWTLSIYGGRFNQNKFVLMHALDWWQSKTLKKVLLNLISLVFQTFNTKPPSVGFCPAKFKSKSQHLWTCIKLSIYCFSFLLQYPDSQKLPKKPIKNFSRLKNNSRLSPITTGFLSSIKIWMECPLVVKTFSMVILLILVLSLKYWPSDTPNNAIYIVLLDIETLNSPQVEVWYLPSRSLVKTWNLWKSFDKPGFWFFLWIRYLMVQKFQNLLLFLIFLGMESHLWPQLHASYIPPGLQQEDLRFWMFLVLLTILSVPCNWYLIVQKNQGVIFDIESSGFSKPGFAITTTLLCSYRISIENWLLILKNWSNNC